MSVTPAEVRDFRDKGLQPVNNDGGQILQNSSLRTQRFQEESVLVNLLAVFVGGGHLYLKRRMTVC